MATRPVIDYTNKDYASLRQALLDLARYRLPEWTDTSPADFGMLMVDLFAYMGDVVLYYQDRIANNLFPASATERRSVMNLLRLIGYEMGPPTPAAVDLNLYFKPPSGGGSSLVVIPKGAQFATKGGAGSVIFQYTGEDLTVDLSSAQVVAVPGDPDSRLLFAGLPLRQCRTVPTEVIGSSTGEPNQTFALSQKPLVLDSLVVEVNEGAAWVRWERRDNLLYYVEPDGRVTNSGADSRDYTVRYDEIDVAWVGVGDNVFGRIPPAGTNNIRASYMVCDGALGNVAAGTVTDFNTPVNNALLNANTRALLSAVTNPFASGGGADHESTDHAAAFGPLVFRSGQRAVTLSDYTALAYQVGGVAKARARSQTWNQVDLFVAPVGENCGPTPEDLRSRIAAFFEDKRMAGTTVNILDATCVPIDVSLEVVPDAHYRADVVQAAVTAAASGVLAYANVDFGQTLYLSELYAAVEAVPGVVATTITRFRRQDSLEQILPELQQLGFASIAAAPAFLVQALGAEIQADGHIDLGPYEIPTLGALGVMLKGGVP